MTTEQAGPAPSVSGGTGRPAPFPPDFSFRRLAAITSVLAGVAALTDIVFTIIAADGKSNVGDHLLEVLRSGSTHAAEMRVAWVADVFAYLLLIPIFLYLPSLILRRYPQRAAIYAVCGLLYIAIGSIGAAILAVVVPHLMRDYVTATGGQRPAMEVTFSTMYRVVVDGLWDVLETIPGGIFWIGTGLFIKQWSRALGWFSIFLGVLALLSSLGNMLELGFVTSSGLGELWALVGTIWLFWIGIVLFRRPLDPAEVE